MFSKQKGIWQTLNTVWALWCSETRGLPRPCVRSGHWLSQTVTLIGTKSVREWWRRAGLMFPGSFGWMWALGVDLLKPIVSTSSAASVMSFWKQAGFCCGLLRSRVGCRDTASPPLVDRMGGGCGKMCRCCYYHRLPLRGHFRFESDLSRHQFYTLLYVNIKIKRVCVWEQN